MRRRSRSARPDGTAGRVRTRRIGRPVRRHRSRSFPAPPVGWRQGCRRSGVVASRSVEPAAKTAAPTKTRPGAAFASDQANTTPAATGTIVSAAAPIEVSAPCTVPCSSGRTSRERPRLSGGSPRRGEDADRLEQVERPGHRHERRTRQRDDAEQTADHRGPLVPEPTHHRPDRSGLEERPGERPRREHGADPRGAPGELVGEKERPGRLVDGGGIPGDGGQQGRHDQPEPEHVQDDGDEEERESGRVAGPRLSPGSRRGCRRPTARRRPPRRRSG